MNEKEILLAETLLARQIRLVVINVFVHIRIGFGVVCAVLLLWWRYTAKKWQDVAMEIENKAKIKTNMVA